MEGDYVWLITSALPSGICAGWRVPWSWSPAEGVGCAVNPSLGRTALGTEPRGPAGGCQHGWELLCACSGWRMSPTAAFDGDRTNLTLPRGCWARGGVWPSSTRWGFFLPASSPWM